MVCIIATILHCTSLDHATHSYANTRDPHKMFRRQNKLDVSAHGNVQKSRSMEILLSESGGDRLRGKRATSVETVLSAWQELAMLKVAAPCVTCLLPHFSEDLVSSALLAVGATPLMTEDADDIDRDIENSKAVMVDVSAPTKIVEAFAAAYQKGSIPLVLVVSGVGTSDRKRDLASKLIKECEPTVVLGRRGDVYALSQVILEKCDTDNIEVEGSAEEKLDLNASYPLPRPMESPHRFRKKISAPSDPSITGFTGTGSIPIAVSKKIQEQQGKGVKRLPSINPLLRMKGQFRESGMGDICAPSSLKFAQLLAAHIGSYVHLYEANIITNGEMVAEVCKQARGMENIHSLLPTCGAVLAAALSCSTGPVISMKTCTYGLALHYLSCEEAVASFKCKDQAPPPGSLRQVFVDKLFKMDEVYLQSKAKITTYSMGVDPS